MSNKKNQFPFNPDYIPPDDTFLYDDAEDDYSAEYMRMSIQGLLSIMDHTEPDGERVAPDKFGCYCVFGRNFISGQLADAFPKIARAFLTHEYTHIDAYASTVYMDGENTAASPFELFSTHILGLMISAFASNNTFTRQLFFNLIKTYYRKDYNILKRFRTITAREIVGIALSESEINTIPTLARLLFFCEVINIDMQPGCDILYSMLNKFNAQCLEYSDENTQFEPLPEDLYDESMRWLEEQNSKIKRPAYRAKEYKSFFYASELCSLAFKHNGFAEDFADINSYGMEISSSIATVRALMKKIHPTVEFSFSELQYLAQLYYVICCFCNYAEETDDIFGQIIGIYEGNDFGNFIWNDSIIPTDTRTTAKEGVKKIVSKPTAINPATRYKDDDLMAEITSLRAKLHKKELDYERLKDMYSAEKLNLRQVSSKLENYESEHDELIALRNHIYNISENDIVISPESLQEMKEFLQAKKIILIGGHVNWMKKLRSIFPDWVYIESNTSGAVNTNILNSADYVYFFTDYINHSTYYRFIHIVRQCEIPFGYIHSVNIEAVIKQLYDDLNIPL